MAAYIQITYHHIFNNYSSTPGQGRATHRMFGGVTAKSPRWANDADHAQRLASGELCIQRMDLIVLAPHLASFLSASVDSGSGRTLHRPHSWPRMPSHGALPICSATSLGQRSARLSQHSTRTRMCQLCSHATVPPRSCVSFPAASQAVSRILGSHRRRLGQT